MSINEKGQKVKSSFEPLKPELISWDEPVKMEEKTLFQKVKSGGSSYVILLTVLLSLVSFFFLGRMSANSEISSPINVNYQNSVTSENSTRVLDSVAGLATTSKPKPTQKVIPTPNTSGEVIGSKSGKKYYFPWCGTVKRIKLENQVHFSNIEAAKKAGFTPGGNCKGLY